MQLSYSRTIAPRDRGLADRVGNRTADILDDGTTTTTTTTKSLAYATNSNLYVGTTQGSTTLRSVVNDAAGNMLTDSTHPIRTARH
jgi:precorrin-6x reductase